MRVPLIARVEANDDEIRPFPAMDSSAKILFTEGDGNVSEYTVEKVECRDLYDFGRYEINFWLNGIRSGSWKVYVTDSRIVVWNPYSKGLIGKPKENAGKASAGHLYYGSVAQLNTFFDQDGIPVLEVICLRHDATRTAFAIQSSDLELMRRCATELHDRIDTWIVKTNTKMDYNAAADQGLEKVMKDWDNFPSIVYKNKELHTTHTTVCVPCESWDIVPNSRILSDIYKE